MATSEPIRSISDAERQRRIELGNRNRKHGLADSPTYTSWRAMKARCGYSGHVAYSRYGASGITIYGPWMDFSEFLADMGVRPEGETLERIDNTLGYSPENCKWATKTEQNRNTKANVFAEVNGQRKCLSEWSKITGIGLTTLKWRFEHGLTGANLINPDRSCGKAQTRKTHCPQGHKYTAENTYFASGCRKCRTCNRIRAQVLRAKKQ